jgi:peptidoglycan hydrolase-like protein with peptidoglycan-binding domain
MRRATAWTGIGPTSWGVIIAAVVVLVAVVASSSAGGGRVQDSFLMRGDRGPDVCRWQKRLNDWIRLETTGQERLEVDGIFGPSTEEATLALQRTKGLEADGIVGPKTRRALKEALGESRRLASEPVADCPPASAGA